MAATLAILLALIPTMTIAAAPSKQLIELRTYHFASAEKQAAFAEFAAEALIPALNRAGIEPVGLFQLAEDPAAAGKEIVGANDLVMVLPYPDAATLAQLPRKLDADAAYQAAGKEILSAGPADPAFTRMESSLLLSFGGVPKLEVPHLAENRVLQLRVYESHNEDRALRKVEMFDIGGELEIFRRVGMPPVFFGQALVGENLPNLTYMLSFESPAALEAGWNAFRTDDAWNKLKTDPKYADTVSHIMNVVLRPMAGSQI